VEPEGIGANQEELALNKVATTSSKAAVTLTPENKTELAEIVKSVKRALRTNIETIYRAGRELVRAKAILGHGAFLPWLEKSFGASNRTAQYYMSVAEKIGDKYETVAHLPPATVYQIAHIKKADDRETLIALIDAKEVKTAADVTKAIDAMDKQAIDNANAAYNAANWSKIEAMKAMRPGYDPATSAMICADNKDPIGRAANLSTGLESILNNLFDFGGNAFECLATHKEPSEQRQALLNVMRQIQQAAEAFGSLAGAQGFPTGRLSGLSIRGDEAVTEDELPSVAPIPATPIGGRIAA
jgi:hypothetical protein